MTERFACANPACSRTILPATAAATGGFCGPCHRARVENERAAFIQANRRTINPYEGVTDPVQLILHIIEPRSTDPLEEVLPPPSSLEDLYAGLTSAEAARLVTASVHAFAQGSHHKAEKIVRCLVCLTSHPVDELLDTFVAHHHYTPAIAFSRTGPAIREILLRRIAQPEAPYNRLLLALAWIGDDQVVQQFAAWRDQPPSWAVNISIPPEEYAFEAGWELTTDGRRHNLIAPIGYALVPRTGPAKSPVTVVRETLEMCGWCGQPLIALFTLDCTDPSLAWLAVNAALLRILTCPTCACYGDIYTYADAAEHTGWHPANQRPTALPKEARYPLPADQLELSVQPRAPLYAADWLLPIRFSQVGGHPTWIDDAWYPHCPNCTHRMPFVAQLSVSDITLGEGIYYAFLCPTCCIAATSYQQT